MPSPVASVNPLQGTASAIDFSTGNTLPLIARPFGLHHWTLQTARGPWLFHPAHRKLWGMRLTHQPSPWMRDYASLTISPFCGPPPEGLAEMASSYIRKSCSPHRCSVELLRYGISFEMAPTRRGAVFVFESSGEAPLSIRFHGDEGLEIAERGGRMVAGTSRDRCSGVPGGFALHFAGEFDAEPEGFFPAAGGGCWVFARGKRRITLRLAASFIDADQARTTLRRELSGKSLAEVAMEGECEWDALLQRHPAGLTRHPAPATLFSCLYRCLLFPRFLDEVSEAGETVHRSPYDGLVHRGPLCTDNGFWDTHRTVYPLLASLCPETLTRILEGWLNACRQTGWSPKWPSPDPKDCMIGTHFNAVVADAVARGVTDWDVAEAYEFLWRDASIPSDSGRFGRRGLEDYIRLGYVPSDKFPHAVSSTLDYAYDDFCVGQVAKFLRRDKEARLLAERSQNYRSLYDASTGFMRGRMSDGAWREPFREFAWGGDYIEGGPWQYLFHVPHDPGGLASLMGGGNAVCERLDRMLALPPTFEAGDYPGEIHEMTEMAHAGFGQYAHSNQPVHGYLFLYAIHGQPQKTAHWVGRVARELYGPDFFPGDEDNGEMAAWYVWASLGAYPHCPGKAELVRFPALTVP